MSRRFGASTGSLLVMASMIGTGVFTTTGFLIRDLPSASAVLLAWALGGALALCGALGYAELGTMFPNNGGEYQLLTRIYGPGVGFVAGWVSLLVGFAAPTAAAAVAFAEYAQALSPIGHRIPLALAAAIGMALVHGVNIRWGARVQNVVTCLELALMLAFILAGALARGDRPVHWAHGEPLLVAVASPAFAVALVYVSFAYSGWNAAAYLAGELRAPGRTLPRSLLLGTGITTIGYLGLNLVFLTSAPPEELAGALDVGKVAGLALFGARGAQVLSAFVALAMLLTLAALIMTGSRVYEAMGRDYPRLGAWLQRGRSRSRGPLAAIALQVGVACALIVSASFEALLTFVGGLLSVFSALTIGGVFLLRWREPGLRRPYRA
ncbi:MAG TPA: amino acid permease, partial [Polyangiaceae bacterium]|nr:amino acid permease [Polyangiaceae bacterium]